MKQLNTMKFVTNMTEEVAGYKAAIKAAETYDEARNKAYKMRGYIDCAVTFLNTMICKENNGFTAELDEVLNGWTADMYQALASKATETQQPVELIGKLLRARDEYSD